MNKKTFMNIALVVSMLGMTCSVAAQDLVIVKDLYGNNVYSLKASRPGMTIKQLKEKIEEKVGSEKKIENLIYAGKELEDERTLADYHLLPDDQFRNIKGWTWDAPIIHVLFKKKVAEEPEVEKKPYVMVQISTGVVYNIEDVTTDTTVKDFREKVSGKMNEPIDTIRLIYAEKELVDKKKLSDYDIVPKTRPTVQVLPRTREIDDDGGDDNSGSGDQKPSLISKNKALGLTGAGILAALVTYVVYKLKSRKK